MFSEEEKKLLAVLPGGVPDEFIHVPQLDGKLQLKRFLDCTKSDLARHIRWFHEVIERADPAELEFVAQFYGETPDKAM